MDILENYKTMKILYFFPYKQESFIIVFEPTLYSERNKKEFYILSLGKVEKINNFFEFCKEEKLLEKHEKATKFNYIRSINKEFNETDEKDLLLFSFIFQDGHYKKWYPSYGINSHRWNKSKDLNMYNQNIIKSTVYNLFVNINEVENKLSNYQYFKEKIFHLMKVENEQKILNGAFRNQSKLFQIFEEKESECTSVYIKQNNNVACFVEMPSASFQIFDINI